MGASFAGCPWSVRENDVSKGGDQYAHTVGYTTRTAKNIARTRQGSGPLSCQQCVCNLLPAAALASSAAWPDALAFATQFPIDRARRTLRVISRNVQNHSRPNWIIVHSCNS